MYANSSDKFFTHIFQFIYTPTVFGYIVEMAALSHPPQKQLKIKIHNKILQPKYMYTTLNRTGIHINNPQNLTLQQRNISYGTKFKIISILCDSI